MSEAGKGDKRRPTLTTARELAIRWELAFGNLTDAQKAKLKRELANGHR